MAIKSLSGIDLLVSARSPGVRHGCVPPEHRGHLSGGRLLHLRLLPHSRGGHHLPRQRLLRQGQTSPGSPRSPGLRCLRSRCNRQEMTVGRQEKTVDRYMASWIVFRRFVTTISVFCMCCIALCCVCVVVVIRPALSLLSRVQDAPLTSPVPAEHTRLVLAHGAAVLAPGRRLGGPAQDVGLHSGHLHAQLRRRRPLRVQSLPDACADNGLARHGHQGKVDSPEPGGTMGEVGVVWRSALEVEMLT